MRILTKNPDEKQQQPVKRGVRLHFVTTRNENTELALHNITKRKTSRCLDLLTVAV